MAKQRKPFVSRKKRREIDEARTRREAYIAESAERKPATTPIITDKKPMQLPPSTTVGEFSKLLNLPVVTVISSLMKNGIMAPVTATIDYDTMAIVADELGFIAEPMSQESESEQPVVETISEGTTLRPPVVAVMGHVDHGKTSLLDRIRQTSVAHGEHGGITQHIGAYQATIEHEGQPRLITFLDTPGHAAFTSMRSHGAQIADIAILVVASDDGVKPQTIEAIQHARNANAPIIVAITKSDVPGANIDRVKQQLTEQNLIPEEWGGTTIMTPVSSVTGEGINELLEYIVLTADLKGYKADPEASPQGVVIESHQKTGLGPIATVLVQNGTLNQGDVIVIGKTYGKIRAMTSYNNERVVSAGPSTPVVIAGLQTIPNFGEPFVRVASEKEARDLTENKGEAEVRHSVIDISKAIAEGRSNTLNIVLKADTQGSLEALRHAIGQLQQPGVKPVIIHSGIGDISASDIQLASAGQAVILGFHVAVPASLRTTAEREAVTISTFKIIYDLLDQVEMILKGRVRVKKILVERGRLKVKKVFRTTKELQIVGGEITQGVAINTGVIAIMRNDEEAGRGKVISIQKGPESVNELEAGQECGVSLQSHEKVLEGDVLIFSSEENKIVDDQTIAE